MLLKQKMMFTSREIQRGEKRTIESVDTVLQALVCTSIVDILYRNHSLRRAIKMCTRTMKPLVTFLPLLLFILYGMVCRLSHTVPTFNSCTECVGCIIHDCMPNCHLVAWMHGLPHLMNVVIDLKASWGLN